MQFIMSTGWEEGIAALSRRLATELAAGKRTLWLVSGGSNIEASVEVMQTIPPENSYLLSIMPVDERYGPPGHNDSNWAQLMAAEPEPGDATLLPVLKAGLDFKATAEHYENLVAKAFTANDVVIAQLGIGDDGHVAGILPDSAATEDTDKLTVAYRHPSFQRLSLSFAGLRHVTAAYAFAYGQPKAKALRQLQTKDLPLAEQPSQILKQLPEAYLFSDQVKANK